MNQLASGDLGNLVEISSQNRANGWGVPPPPRRFAAAVRNNKINHGILPLAQHYARPLDARLDMEHAVPETQPHQILYHAAHDGCLLAHSCRSRRSMLCCYQY